MKKPISSPFFKNPANRIRKKPQKFYFSKIGKVTKIIFSLIGLLVIVSAPIYLVFGSKYFTIENVEISGLSRFVSAKDFTKMSVDNSVGKNLITFNTAKLAENLKNTFQGTDLVVVEKKLPKSLVITVSERIPLAIVTTDHLGFYLIDKEGYVLGQVEPENTKFPIIQYSEPITVGTFIAKDIIPISRQILAEAEKESLKISSMSFTPKYTRMFVNTGVEAYIGNSKDKTEAMRIINSLLTNVGENNPKVQKIDLRYEKVIVLYEGATE